MSNAIAGIRNMPAHGGNPNLTDTGLRSAIVYMFDKGTGAKG